MNTGRMISLGREGSLLAIFAIFLLYSGCATFLPSGKNVQTLPWKNFAEADAAYQRIKPGTTKILESEAWGFDLHKVSGSVEQNPYETRNTILGPNASITIVQIRKSLRVCLGGATNSKGDVVEVECRARIFPIKFQEERHVGNFFEDKFNFQTKVRTIGSSMTPLLIYRTDNNVIIDATRDYSPLINNLQIEKDPMGPITTIFGGATGAGVHAGLRAIPGF